jgi:hypothetical protein
MSSPEEAARLAADNPCWLVIYGTWTRDLVVYPRFKVPPGTWLAAPSAAVLLPRMRKIETLAKTATHITNL